MPTIRIEELARLRLDAISFFLMVILLCAVATWLLWNWVGKDLKFLPRISFLRALSLVVVAGLFFLLVLTMISGARELMTPGAWKRDGLTYRLAARDDKMQWVNAARRTRLEQLRDRLWEYAGQHDGGLPADEFHHDIADGAWRTIADDATYIYLPGHRVEDHPIPLVYEPGVFGDERYVLLANGDIQLWDIERIHLAIRPDTDE